MGSDHGARTVGGLGLFEGVARFVCVACVLLRPRRAGWMWVWRLEAP